MDIKVGDITNPLAVGIVSLISYFAGLDWELLWIYLIIMVIDVLVAVVFSAENGVYRSDINSYGLYRKVGEFLTLLALVLVQRVVIKYGLNVPFSPAITTMFIFKEMGSILETLARNGVRLPVRILNWFEKSLDMMENVQDEHIED